VPEDDVRRAVGRGAPGEPPREQIPQTRRDDVRRLALGGGDDDDTDRPASGDQVPQQDGELLALLLGPTVAEK
jgi:hypothetical protein